MDLITRHIGQQILVDLDNYAFRAASLAKTPRHLHRRLRLMLLNQRQKRL